MGDLWNQLISKSLSNNNSLRISIHDQGARTGVSGFLPQGVIGIEGEGAILVTSGLGKEPNVYVLKGGVENLHIPGKIIGF